MSVVQNAKIIFCQFEEGVHKFLVRELSDRLRAVAEREVSPELFIGALKAFEQYHPSAFKALADNAGIDKMGEKLGMWARGFCCPDAEFRELYLQYLLKRAWSSLPEIEAVAVAMETPVEETPNAASAVVDAETAEATEGKAETAKESVEICGITLPQGVTPDTDLVEYLGLKGRAASGLRNHSVDTPRTLAAASQSEWKRNPGFGKRSRNLVCAALEDAGFNLTDYPYLE